MTFCSICLKTPKTNHGKNFMLSPMTCVQKYGTRAHKICQWCWFNIFAKENANHKCPGCIKKLNLTVPPKSTSPAVVINLTD